MARRVEVRDKKYQGIVCALICTENGSLYVEIKDPGVKEKKIVKINKYLQAVCKSEVA